jgi:hypothetical protein
VHGTLLRVVTNDTVDDDLHLTLGEVSVRAPAGLGLRRRGREHEERETTDDERKETLEEELCEGENVSELVKSW